MQGTSLRLLYNSWTALFTGAGSTESVVRRTATVLRRIRVHTVRNGGARWRTFISSESLNNVPVDLQRPHFAGFGEPEKVK